MASARTQVLICISVALIGICIPRAKATSRPQCRADNYIQWDEISSGLKVISIGEAGVWGVNVHNHIYYRDGTYKNDKSLGYSWTRLEVESSLVNLDVGDDIVVGVNGNNDAYCREGITMENPTGLRWLSMISNHKVKQLSISPKGHLVGVTTDGEYAFRHGLDGRCTRVGQWFVAHKPEFKLRQISAGKSGVWAVGENGHIYYRLGTFRDNGRYGHSWEQVETPNNKSNEEFSSGYQGPKSFLIKYVSVGNFVVYAITQDDFIFRREGISLGDEAGTDWTQINGSLKTIDTYNTCDAWGVNVNDTVFHVELTQP